jgi:gliding motility-associated-like protein
MVYKKNVNNLLLGFSFLMSVFSLNAQVQNNPPMRNVLGTAGSSGTLPSGNTIDYTVGECVVATVGPFNTKFLTQGFQQSDGSSSTLNETVNSVNSSCSGANNGSVMFQNISSTGPVTISWNGGAPGTVTLFSDLAPGSYPYVVSDGNFSITDTVIITEANIDCGEQLTFYQGITPNADGNNDMWVIDGITNFAESKVMIFNRWGDLVWQADNYDNTTIVWDGKNSKGGELTDATYFYLVEAGGKTYKGWVELTH